MALSSSWVRLGGRLMEMLEVKSMSVVNDSGDNWRYIAKELSWLLFNERVLQEAADESVPIIQRVRYLGIFSSNLDEFFRVRVADVKRLVVVVVVTGRGWVAAQAAKQERVGRVGAGTRCHADAHRR